MGNGNHSSAYSTMHPSADSMSWCAVPSTGLPDRVSSRPSSTAGTWDVTGSSLRVSRNRTSVPRGRLANSCWRVAAWIAQQERIRLAERTKAGLQRAKAAGNQIERRPRRVFQRSQVLELRAAGQSWRQIATALGVGLGTVRRAYPPGTFQRTLSKVQAQS